MHPWSFDPIFQRAAEGMRTNAHLDKRKEDSRSFSGTPTVWIATVRLVALAFANLVFIPCSTTSIQ